MGFNDAMQHSRSSSSTGGGKWIRIEGTDELIANLRKALLKHTEKEVRNALKGGGHMLVDAAKNNVRVNDGGNLKRSIKILPKWSKDPLGIYVGPRVIRRFTSKTSQKRKDQNPFYAHWVEYGTDPHNLGYKGKYFSGKGGNHPGTDKHPYMRPAYDSMRGRIIEVMMRDIEKMILDGVR